MRYRVTHRSAAARPGLTQVLGLMGNMSLAVVGLLIANVASAQSTNKVVLQSTETGDCATILIDTPGSSKARVCFTKQIEGLEKRMGSLEAAITSEIQAGLSPFTLKDFQAAQVMWRNYANSTCYLDAAGAGNINAVFMSCFSIYLAERVDKLESLRAGVSGEDPVQWPMSNLKNARSEP